MGLFLYEDFWKDDILACVETWNLVNNNRVLISWRILVSLRGCFEDLYIFEGFIKNDLIFFKWNILRLNKNINFNM
jgi:hypothetical protein